MTTISVAMATCDGERHLAEQLASLADQTRPPDELVVSDDASRDGTIALVEAFAATASFPVRLLRNARRLGYNANFAQAIEACTGATIFVCDQDDRWFAPKIARMAAALDVAPRALLATCDQRIVDGAGRSERATVLGNVRSLGYPDGAFGPGCCTALRRDLLAIARPFPGDAVPYDHWLTTLAARLGARLLVEEPLQVYRRHGANASASVFARPRPGWRAAIADARGTDARARMAATAAGIEAVAARLAGRRAAIAALGLGDRLPAALAALALEAADHRARAAALGRGPFGRPIAVAGLLRRGTYRRFRGMRTMLKDLAG